MTTRVLSVGLLAGIAAGLLVAMLQYFTTTPLILAAEVFEKASESTKAASLSGSSGRAWADGGARLIFVHGGSDHGKGHGSAETGQPGDKPSEWQPADGVERTVYASTVTVGTSIGFALLLLAGMLLAGDRIDEKNSLAWAAAGFVVTGLAPALGLSPELPGMSAAALDNRQLWWAFTAVATAGALWMFLRTDAVWLRALSVVLLVAPHVGGAPHLPEGAQSAVPAELAAHFAAASLVVHASLWILTGLAVAWLWQRAEARKPA